MIEADILMFFGCAWIIISICFLAGFWKIIDLAGLASVKYFDRLDVLFQTLKKDREDHRQSLKLIRDDLLNISGGVSEIRRVARSCEYNGNK